MKIATSKIILIIALLFSYNIIDAQTFTASPNQVLGQGTNINFTQSVIGVPTSSNDTYGLYEVRVSLSHPLTSEVSLALQSPSGTYVQLSYNNGAGANYTNAKFRRYADSSIRYTNSPYNATYMCYDNTFGDFTNGQNPNGIWTLVYYDNANNTAIGTLQSWSLTFAANPNTTALNNAHTNLPIFKINTPIGYIPQEPKTPGTIFIINNITGGNNYIGTPTTTLDLGIEIQGYTSSGGDKPNYDIELHTPAGLDTSYPLLGMNPESDYILKGAVTDEWMMKDALTFELSNRMKYYAPHTRYVELLINNEYKGVYILQEKIKRDSNRVSIKKLLPTSLSAPAITGGYILEINPNGDAPAWYSLYPGYQGQNLTNTYEYKIVYPKQDIIPTAQFNYIHNFTDSFETALHNTGFQNPITGWRKYADEKSIINFLIVSEYSNNYDTYGRSMYLYKENIVDGNKFKIGPPWDSDRGYSSDTGWVHINTHGYWIFPFWWQQLRQDSLFNKRLACRYQNMRKAEISDTAFTNFITNTDLYTRHALQRNTSLWQNYLAPINDFKTTCLNRMAWMDSKLSPVVYPANPLTNTTACVGSPVNIFTSNLFTYNFTPGPDTSYFTPTQAGNYIASVTSQYGCETKQPFTVIAQPTPSMIGNTLVCANTNSLYKINNIIGSTYNWSISGGSPITGCGSTDSLCIVLWTNAGIGSIQVTQQIANCNGSASKNVTINNCTATNDIVNPATIKLFPNPTKSIVTIETDKEINSIKLMDLTGKVLIETKSKTISLKEYQIGLYFLLIEHSNNETFLMKVAKE
jgi:subtilisin-like proprotein convertase family protein